MQRIRLLLPLLALLGLATWGAALGVARITRAWTEDDVSLRATLAVRGARRELVRQWTTPPKVERALEEISRDERILAAAACSPSGELVARTSELPPDLGCGRMLALFDEAALASTTSLAPRQVLSLPSGHVLLNAVHLDGDGGQRLGFVVLLHDLAYAEAREATAQRLAVAVFATLSILIALAALLFERATFRGLRAEVKRVASGGRARPELAPLLADVRELADRLADDAQARPALGWTKDRLRETLARSLAGERVVILANREPYIHQRKGDTIEVQHPASGLVTALEPVMRACSGVWVAHGSGTADRETSDAKGRVWVPPGEKLYSIRRVWLTEQEEAGYYYGFSNEGLWPLCHVAHARPRFRDSDFSAYVQVNGKFADAVAEEVDRDDPIVLVQDYHLACAPRQIRDRIPGATILTFWHIPWPNAERFGICPQSTELLEGLLGSSIVGFHTQQHCNNFLEAVERHLEARIDRELDAVLYQGRWTLVRAYPISIEWPNRWVETAPSIEECRASVRAEHGIREDVAIGVGVDRLDYTKGIEERLLAVERLFERHPDLVGRFTFIQLGAPSRTKIATYGDLNDQIARLAERIHQRFATDDWTPLVFHRAHHEPQTVFRYYRAADVCYVSSLHDGMNLVAKEFVAARDDERGVLVLSRFTGAARELTEALVVNPYDLEQASDALASAVRMPESAQRERMRALRSYVSEWNVYRWAGRMLADAARLRAEGRVAERLGEASVVKLRRPRMLRAAR